MKTLPIAKKEELIVATILENQVVIVEGETGSGKTTQLPIFLYEAGFSQQGIIGITQPRRFAATSVAQYVASLSGKPLGDIVGFQVRFEKESDRNTAIKFMTAGILLQEAVCADPLLSRYSVIMVDEAHERTEEMDLLLGLLKGVLAKRKNLRLIVASATIDTKKFSCYFGGAPIIKVSGKMFPVRVHYAPRSITDSNFLVRRIADKVLEVHGGTLSGHILVFVAGKQDVHHVIEEIEMRQAKQLLPLPLYGGMDPKEQAKVFCEYPQTRKVIVATNLAETSVTVDGIGAVIDSGLIKENDINSENSIGELDIIEHSQAGCDQRKGRAGRTRAGVCWRMYTETNFKKRLAFTRPEIQRVSPLKTLLAMASVGITDPAAFPFIDQPDPKVLRNARETLSILGALDRRGQLTPLGLQMSTLPMDPIAAKLVLEGRKYGCLKEMITIAAFLGMPQALLRPKGKEAWADEKHREFLHEQSDLLTFLKVWRAYRDAGEDKEWCRARFLNPRTLWEIRQSREQLKERFRKAGVELTSGADEATVMKCAVGALRYSMLEYRPKEGYCALFENAQGIAPHPASVLAGAKVQFIVPTHVVETKRRYARNCTIARVEWLAEFLPELFLCKETVVRSWGAEAGQVVGEQIIAFRGKPIGMRTVTLSLEEAQKMQTKAQAGKTKKK